MRGLGIDKRELQKISQDEKPIIDRGFLQCREVTNEDERQRILNELAKARRRKNENQL